MGSCVSKKAARAGAKSKASAPPLPVADKETTRALPPVAEAVDEEEVEEVKEVVLSEAPPPPRPPPPAPVKQRQQPVADDEEEDESAPSEACSASDAASMDSAAKEKAKAKAKLLHKLAGAELEATEKRTTAAADAPRKGREGKGRSGGGAAGNARARSPSPSSANSRRQQQQQQQNPPAARPRRREQPAVVSGIGCRSGRFSPSAARRAAESAAVRRTHSAREADMALPSSMTKRSLTAAINGGMLSRRDAGERSGRRSDSPTAGRRAPASPMRKAGREHGTPERTRPRARDGDEQPPLPEAAAGGGEHKKVEEGALGQNPSVAMECFIFL
ncbi:hypothetical protein HU200_022650 [Digitaria exilis]|uniref:Uncharacterized protein n=1 Tax=Digitaria exilis TaxID=1010633 RepID=A0A835C2F9_9POAL|nr:hypothetical protein HU200_022650 [Digitaria exilis]CAB3494083.1 unnamed protein product [Digitaria exilis]